MSTRVWGRNADGTPYVVGITVGELRRQLERFSDTHEICMVVCRKKDQNGAGLWGKLTKVDDGAAGQLWLTGSVLDKDLE